MGNTSIGNNARTSASRYPTSGRDSTSKQIQISVDRSDGFYFTGEILCGRVEIPVSHLHQHFHSKNNRKALEFLRQQLLRNDIAIELVGDATYSAEVDAAADSDGHATHQVNICRQRCFVTINQDTEELSAQNDNQVEMSFNQKPTTFYSSPKTPNIEAALPAAVKGTFQLQIPDGLPPSLLNNRTPTVIYTLELSLPSSSYRYQIPIIINSKGCLPHPTDDIELNGSTMGQHNICLQAYLPRRFYRPSEQIPIRVKYLNPQQRSVRSITITLIQLYRVHNDQYRLELDGKEWIFDASTMLPQREWSGETLLQLPGQPLEASFPNEVVGTTHQIECELDYRIFIELNERKGDDIHLTLPSINVTYQK